MGSSSVRAGTGIGICHDFMAAGDPGLIRIFPQKLVTRSYWLVRHENQAVARRVEAVVDLLDQIVRQDRQVFCSDLQLTTRTSTNSRTSRLA